jgi:acyl-CoA reductase-like NAD-dependent aldehyde dehydrogenase
VCLARANRDHSRTVAAGILARFSNTGQICLNAKRFILEKPIAQEFITKFVEAAKQLKVGDPRDPATSPRIPVGGVKNSGYGRELSHFGIREFTNAQAVWVKHV